MAPLCSKNHHPHSQCNKKPDMSHLMGGTPASLTLSLSISIFPLSPSIRFDLPLSLQISISLCQPQFKAFLSILSVKVSLSPVCLLQVFTVFCLSRKKTHIDTLLQAMNISCCGDCWVEDSAQQFRIACKYLLPRLSAGGQGASGDQVKLRAHQTCRRTCSRTSSRWAVCW